MEQNPQSQLKLLVQRGKEQGYLTYAEVNDHLPEDIVDSDQIEDIIQMINDMGIQVMEEAPDADDLLLAETPTTLTKMQKKLLRRFCPALNLKSGVQPTRCACTCVKWVPLNC
jgi:hypothetical protein